MPGPSTTPVKWVASDHDGLPVKRKQVAQACDTCRKRKKRCVHTEGGDAPAQTSAQTPAQASRHASVDSATRPSKSKNSGEHASNSHAADGTSASPEEEDEDATQVAANRLMQLFSSRFISDLNPEGMFLQAAKPLPPSGTPYRDKNDLGVWLPPGASTSEAADADEDEEEAVDTVDTEPVTANGSDAGRKAPSSASSQRPVAKRRRSRNYIPSATGRTSISDAAFAYEKARYAFAKECLTVYPPDEDFAVLHRIYCEKVHPILPVLKESELERFSSTSPAQSAHAQATPQATPTPPASLPVSSFLTTVFPTIIKQIISLAAALTDGDAAEQHLRLEPGGVLLSPREFHHRLADAVSSVIDADLIPHRFDYIRACILLSFFYQPSSELDRNKPSFLCTQAAHHFQTIGAHLLGYRPENPEDDAERIFCALWALDRLAAIIYARPCMMHAYDNGKNPEDCATRQPPCFRLFMSVIIWLDKVLHLYRPRQPFVMIDIPVYEAMILDAQAEKLPSVLLCTIEVLYHTACVLSCRQPLSAFSEVDDRPLNRDDRNYLPISIMNPRRSHSSDRIVWVTQTQSLCLFPFVPYAVSIALSVQYKKMRYSRTPLFRTRARQSFKDIVALLKGMGDVFINARINAALGTSIWKQMEKTATTLVQEPASSNGQTQADSGAPSRSDNGARKTSMAPPAKPARSNGTNGTSTANRSTSTANHTPIKTVSGNSTAPSAQNHNTQPQGTFMLVPGPVRGTAVMPPAVALSNSASNSASNASNSASQPQLQAIPTNEMPYMPGEYVSATALQAQAQQTHQAGLPTASLNGISAAIAQSEPVGQLPMSTSLGMIGTGTPGTAAPLLDLSVLDTLDTDIDLFNNFDPSFDLGAIDTALEANLDMQMPQNWGWSHLS